MSNDLISIVDLTFDLDAFFEACDADDLTDYEENFVNDLHDRYKKFGIHTTLTVRQHDLLLRIYRARISCR